MADLYTFHTLPNGERCRNSFCGFCSGRRAYRVALPTPNDEAALRARVLRSLEAMR